jgi:hypothetical protein
MQLGAVQPIRTINVAQVQSPAKSVNYVPTPPTSGNEQSQPASPSGSPFSPDNLKKYAPYIIGAVILFYLLNRKK